MSNIPHNANTAAGAQHNTHNPLTGDGVTNTHNPLTGDKTGPNPPAGTNPMTGRTKDGELGRNEQHGIGHGTTGNVGAGHAFGDNTHNTHNTHNPLTGNGATNTHNPATGDHTGTNLTGSGTGTGNHTHNTHNPLTGDGVTNTRNPLTGDKTGPNPPPGTNPVTGRTKDGELGRHEQHGAGYGATGATGAGLGDNTHNTHNPLTGNGVNNTHNPATGDHTGPHPTAGAHTGTHTGNNTIHDTTHGTHTGAGTTAGGHPTSQPASGGGAKALVGKVEATLGNILHNPNMQAKGVQKQEEAQAAKAAKADAAHDGTTHGAHGTHNATTGAGVPTHDHHTAEKNLAAEGGPAGAGAGFGQTIGGGGHSAI